jgi:glyoxylase-like metal-dependent hydrolase (beta-lactamase superfamily II)
MLTRRKFITSTVGTAATIMLAGVATEGLTQEANVTTAQMLAAGRLAKLTIEPLRNGVSLISGSGGNVLVVPGTDGKLVVDSGLATSEVHMSTALQSISSDPLRHLINTHWHFDHTDGNAWMHAAGATICAQAKTLTRMQHKQVIPEFEGVYPPSPSAALPTVTFEQAKTMRVNGHEIILTRYTPAHTDTDISVFLPDADILHAGDSFFSRFYPFIDYHSGGSIDGMIAACRETLAIIGPSTIVAGGHGPVGRRKDVSAFEQMLMEVRGRVAALKQSGASAKEVVARRPSASLDGQWGNGFISPDLFISLVYRGV